MSLIKKIFLIIQRKCQGLQREFEVCKVERHSITHAHTEVSFFKTGMVWLTGKKIQENPLRMGLLWPSSLTRENC